MTPIKRLIWAALAVVLASVGGRAADAAENDVTIGLILPMTGPFANIVKQEQAAALLYMHEHGDIVAGKKITLIVKDDMSAAEVTKRLAQELIANDHANVLMGFGLTPLALAVAPVVTEAKIPEIVTSAATGMITEKSPYIVRTSFTLPQVSQPMAEWCLRNNVKKLVTFVTDYGPGNDAEKWFSEALVKGGDVVVEKIRVPLKDPNFAPFLQRVKDDAPDGVFVFIPAGFGTIFMKQFVERGLDRSGIKLVGTGDMTDDDLLNGLGDAALGVVTTHHYSAAHDSLENKTFVEAFERANGGLRPNFMAVAAYDGMTMVYQALEKTKGVADGDSLLQAMKGASWTSPRGPIAIDPETRDIVQTIYVREVRRVAGQLYNIEISSTPAVKDPYKASKH
jgi:branched-chain amino acid transport system substrate-binding protein